MMARGRLFDVVLYRLALYHQGVEALVVLEDNDEKVDGLRYQFLT